MVCLPRPIRCSDSIRRLNGCRIHRRFRPRPRRLLWPLLQLLPPPQVTVTSRPHQPGCMHPLSLSSFTAEKKGNCLMESPFLFFFFFTRPYFFFFLLGGRHVFLFVSDGFSSENKQKKNFFFFSKSKADYCVSWFLFQCDAYSVFFFFFFLKIAIQTFNSLKHAPFYPHFCSDSRISRFLF